MGKSRRFFLVLSLFYRSQMVNFKEIFHFSRFQRGSNILQGGSNFFQGGVQLHIPYRNRYNLWSSRGRGSRNHCPPPPPLWIQIWVIFIWEYNFIGSRSSVGSKLSCSSRVREIHFDQTKVHFFLEIGHENRYAFIRHLPLIQEGFLSVSSESICAKSTALYPYSTQGPNPTNRHELTNIWICGWNVLS